MVLDGLSEGLLASAVTLETGVGGPACPWVIRVQPHQRINITLLDFSLASSTLLAGADGTASVARRGQQYRPSSGRGTAAGAGGGWDAPMSMPSWLGAPCDQYAVVLEGAGGTDGRRSTSVRNATVCGRRRRQSPVYLSDTNVVQVHVDVAASRSHRFVLKYQGLSLSLSTLLTFFSQWLMSYTCHLYIALPHSRVVPQQLKMYRTVSEQFARCHLCPQVRGVYAKAKEGA